MPKKVPLASNVGNLDIFPEIVQQGCQSMIKQQDDGKAFMAEDEAWLLMSNDDEEDSPLCMMVNHQEEEFMSNDDDQESNDRKSSGSESTSQVDSNSYSLFGEQIDILSSKVSDYESKLIKEQNLVASQNPN